MDATAKFHIYADMRLAPTQSLQVGSGTDVILVGDGFAVLDELEFSIGGEVAAPKRSPVLVGPDGTFFAELTMPESKGGIQTIRAAAKNGSRQIKELPVNVTSSLQLIGGSPGIVGSYVTVRARGFEGGAVGFYVESPDEPDAPIPGVGKPGAPVHKDDIKAKRHHVGGNGSTQNMRVQIPTVPRGTWTLVAQQHGGAPDPLTGGSRLARTKISVLPRITHIQGDADEKKWPKRMTVRKEDDSFKTFKVQGNGFEAGDAVDLYHTSINWSQVLCDEKHGQRRRNVYVDGEAH